VHTLRSSFISEINSLRAALDEAHNERARFEVDANKYEKEVRELKSKLRDKEKALDAAEKRANAEEVKTAGLNADLRKAEKELVDLRPENTKLKKQLAEAKKQLEDETLRRIDLQNQLQTAQEGLKFENSLLEQQLNETRMRKQIEISEIDGKLQDQYEEKLQQSLTDLRDTYEKQVRDANRLID